MEFRQLQYYLNALLPVLTKRKSFDYERELCGITALPEEGFERIPSDSDKKRKMKTLLKRKLLTQHI
jgi:hypothetical protein